MRYVDVTTQRELDALLARNEAGVRARLIGDGSVRDHGRNPRGGRMKRVYKLTRSDLTTHNDFRWEPGQIYTFPGTGALCTGGWAHAYTSAALALLLNPIHAKYAPARLWEARGVVGQTDRGLKVGCSSLTLVREIAVPEVTPEQRVMCALWCALSVYPDAGFVAWAEGWLSGKNRAESAAWSAARSAESAAWRAESAAWSAAISAGSAAWSAAWSAESAAWRAAGSAERAAWSAARSAAWSAESAACDLDALASAALLPWEPA